MAEKNCTCLEDTVKQINEKYKEWNGKPVERITLQNLALDFKSGQVVNLIGLDIKFKNQKKLGHTTLRMSHCPLCGKEIKHGE